MVNAKVRLGYASCDVEPVASLLLRGGSRALNKMKPQ